MTSISSILSSPSKSPTDEPQPQSQSRNTAIPGTPTSTRSATLASTSIPGPPGDTLVPAEPTTRGSSAERARPVIVTSAAAASDGNERTSAGREEHIDPQVSSSSLLSRSDHRSSPHGHSSPNPRHARHEALVAAAQTSDSSSSDLKHRRCSDDNDSDNLVGFDGPRSSKRPRYRLKPRHTLDFSSLPQAASSLEGQAGISQLDHALGRTPTGSLNGDSYTPTSRIPPKSPLFFSHHKRQRPPLPARFSSSEASGAMLTKVRDENPATVTTVKLPRAPAPSASSPPSRTMSTPGGRNSLGTSTNRSITPDLGPRSSGPQVLAQVGIVELLEQDGRPTFIIDLKDGANFAAGPLQIEFANTALRSRANLLESLSGSPEQADADVPTLLNYGEFKAWVLSSLKDRETRELKSTTFAYEGFTWTSSTLRKRLRLLSGIAQSPSIKIIEDPVASEVADVVVSPKTVPQPMSISPPTGALQRMSSITETPDYFGPATATSETISDDISPNMAPKVADSTSQPRLSPAVPTEGTSFTDSLNSAPHIENLTMANLQGLSGSMTPSTSIDRGFFDWTRLSSSPSLPEHVQFALGIDWASTSLGPMEDWSNTLRSMCNLIMASPHPAAMYWGEDLVSIYNEAYIQLAGQKHPQLMGSSYRVAWSEIWDSVKDVFGSAILTGQATMKDDDCLFIRRAGFLEETYFSWAIIPLVGEDGSVVGLYNPAFEKTRRKIAERRMLTLREVGERIATARQLSSFWGQVIKGLEFNELDAPFALLYSVTDDVESDVSSTQSNSMISSKQCVLESSIGVPEGHLAAQSPLDLKSSHAGFGPHFRTALGADKPVLFRIDDGTLSPHLLEGLERRGFDDPCTSAVICPIHPTTGEAILGFLIMGINPRRQYDDDYDLFVQLLSRQLATSMASVVLFEEEIKRGQRAANLAARDRIELSQQLAARTQEAEESETKFTRMAEFAPVGMFIANSNGQINYCNETWYEISRHTHAVSDWIDSVKEEDQKQVREMWRKLVEEKVPMTLEFRFKEQWQGRNEVKGDTWVLGSAYPERNLDGSLKSIFGSITNISEIKWAEDFQKKRMEEAVELKRQQENFIDITSHEMRNPLSAILQCADEISSSLSDCLANGETPDAKLLNSNVDAAQTIALCSQHQKRIVDDILTLSKLDSALLLVTPVDVQPISVVQRALKMFEGELETNDIALNFEVKDSYRSLDIDWVRLDPSRLLQVLINLTTNAIKFTHTQRSRTIKVSIDASVERPSKAVTPVVSYFPARPRREDSTAGTDWGSGEEIFIHFAIEDTGRGLSENEKKLLFLRFSQASPRTHVQYGGSGLGLFISRELTELQGGEIGVASESGVGSTFAFYVKARRSSAPTDITEQLLPRQARKASNSSTKLSHKKPPISDLSVKNRETSPAKALETAKSKEVFKVLVVEDNIVNQRVLVKQLRNYGCDVAVANHGEEALDYLRETNFWRNHQESGKELSVILMDLEMPIMSGLTCSRKIRELQRSGELLRHVPIIAVTANARPEQIHIALDAGMDDVMPKPFRIPELIPKMEELREKYGS
ncbi:MAG: hypothetical protein M4579_004931 [Chaenotheca gracillima]|nr:MAG: hypothetical protein M4579_004931 [Chaenotheca gracillima]